MPRQSLVGILLNFSAAVGGPRERNKAARKGERSLPATFGEGELKQSSHSSAVVSTQPRKIKDGGASVALSQRCAANSAFRNPPIRLVTDV